MHCLRHSGAALRITGDSLDPEAISRLLGCRPTLGHAKGQIEPSKGKPIVRETGAWQLDTAGQQPGNLDAHVAELFGRVNNALPTWATVSGEHKIELLCVYFAGDENEVVQASAETLKILGDRGIKLGLRIYSPAEDVAGSVTPPLVSKEERILVS
ncbi:MAG: hypothetical protein QOF24_1329 [Verrucomicrobiota bacterium]|jgi:hypothetical protein